MNLSSMVASVQRVLKDASILRSEIITEINRQQRIATGRAAIPTLIGSGKITLPAGVIGGRMPSDYQHNLITAYSETQDKWLSIRSNTKSLYDGYRLGHLSTVGLPMEFPYELESPDESNVGPIDDVAIEGVDYDGGVEYSVLWCKPATSQEETVQCRYYRLPDEMADDTDTPDGIPEEYHKPIMVSGTLIEKLPDTALDPAMITALIELHSNLYTTALAELNRRFPFAPKHTPKPRRRVREF